MATPNAGSIRFGIASQAAAGTIAANPAYLFGVEGGDIPANPAYDDAPLTSGTATKSNRELRRLEWPFEFTTNAYLGSCGMILKHALGDVTTTGASPTYTHVFEHARPLPAGLSVFKEYSDGGDIHAVRDGKVSSLRLSWEENAPLKLNVSGMGTVYSSPASITAGDDETGVLTYFRPVGGTFKIDIDGTTLAARCTKGGFVELTNAISGDFCSGAVEASSISDNAHDASCGMTVKADVAEWESIVAAVQAGTDLYGSVEWVFKSGTYTLTVEAKRVGFMPYAMPAAARGEEIEVELGGVCYTPTGEEGPVKITLTNGVASY